MRFLSLTIDHPPMEPYDVPEYHLPVFLKVIQRFQLIQGGKLLWMKRSKPCIKQGYTQCYGIDFHETFSSVAKMNSIRALISLAANFRRAIQQLDVKNAFFKCLGSNDAKQRKYVLDLLKEIWMFGCKPTYTPMENVKLCAEVGSHVDVGHFQWLVGKLIYLIVTRPDIPYSVIAISQFKRRP
ncbi:uncharacterized protein [Aristolochia californica]|uniref:uncharacterized protein n=1 Tax=Aristolochia californica TaxID=171875 RepID=UPI0035E2AA66